MFFQRLKTPGIAHNAYLIGTQGIGILIDPRRDIDDYLELAASQSLAIEYVLQTHRQEDFVLGSRAMREATGACVVAGRHPFSEAADRKLHDGEILEIGGVKVQALYTPGHTPESVSFAFSLRDKPNVVWAVFTGDALFIGETGRTDLPDNTRTGENAGILFDAIHSKILPLGDQVLLYPTHGAGSVCGGNIAAYDESTLGFERTYNKVFTLDREAFIRHKMHERIPRPPYFRDMEAQNLKGGSPMTANWQVPRMMPAKAFQIAAAQGIIVDTRLPESYAGAHIPGSYSVWLGGLPVFGGWIASDHPPIFLVLERTADLKTALLHLARIGIDSVAGVLEQGFEGWRNAGLPFESTGTTSPADIEVGTDIPVLDVREITEFEDEGHIDRARHDFVGYMLESLASACDAFEKDRPLAVTCSVGHRASLAVSLLRRAGFKQPLNMIGGMTAWRAKQFAVETGASSRPPLDRAQIETDFPYLKDPTQ